MITKISTMFYVIYYCFIFLCLYISYAICWYKEQINHLHAHITSLGRNSRHRSSSLRRGATSARTSRTSAARQSPGGRWWSSWTARSTETGRSRPCPRWGGFPGWRKPTPASDLCTKVGRFGLPRTRWRPPRLPAPPCPCPTSIRICMSSWTG